MQCQFGPFHLDAANGQLWNNDTPVKMRPKTFDVLVHLVSRAGELVSADELLDAVWADIIVSDSVVRVSIRELRSLFNETDPDAEYIATVHRKGYRFTATTQLLIHSKEAPKPPLANERASLVVLPFLNLSDERIYAYMADGLTEDLTTQLARVPGFFVISRTSAFAYKGQNPDVRRVGEELGVRYVVEGSVRPLGNRVRLTLQLIEAETGNHLWADHCDGQADEDFDIQDQLLRALIGQLEPEVTRAEVTRINRRPATQWDAWDCYRQADGLLGLKGWHEYTFSEGVRLLRQAIELDPEFALAHARLSLLMALGHRVGMIRENRDAVIQKVLDTGERALEIDRTRSEILSYVGCALGDLPDAEYVRRGLELSRQAVDINPSNAQAWAALGAGLMISREMEQGVEHIQHGIRLSPRDHRLAVWRSPLALGLLFLGRGEEAVNEGRLACRFDNRFYPARVTLATIFAFLQQHDQAAPLIAEAHKLRPSLSVEEIQFMLGRRMTQALQQTGLLDDLPEVA